MVTEVQIDPGNRSERERWIESVFAEAAMDHEFIRDLEAIENDFRWADAEASRSLEVDDH